MQEGKPRDKIDVDIRYVKAEQDRQVAAITVLAATLDRCVADARNAVLSVDTIANDALQSVIDAALAKLTKTVKACTTAKDQKVGDSCAAAS